MAAILLLFFNFLFALSAHYCRFHLWLAQLRNNIDSFLSGSLIKILTDVAILIIFLQIYMLHLRRIDHHNLMRSGFVAVSHLLELLDIHVLVRYVDSCVVDSEIFLVDDPLIFYGNVRNVLN